MTTPGEHEIRFEIEGLITLLAQNLYADPDVFLREMIQNAHDSIVKRRELAVRAERGEAAAQVPRGEIRIDTDRTASTLTIVDNGAGLTEDEIHKYLSTIGASGTRELKKTLADRDRGRTIDLIGQFGIGLLSAYIVAARVEITTRSAVGPALQWTSDGGKRYQLTAGERAEVGTTVVLHLRSDHSRYLDPEKLRGIVRRYADFIGIPVLVGGETANAVDAPWHRSYASEKERRQAHRDYWEGRFKEEMSLDILALDEAVEVPDPQRSSERIQARVRGVLGITDRHVPDVNSRGTVEVYVARMFITSGSREALPAWARFIQGIIECDALTPNAARDDVVKNETLEAVKEALGRAILGWLTRLSKEEPKRFVEIMRWHSYHVLAMAVQDEHEDFFRAVADLVPLESDQGPLTIPAYMETAARVSGRAVVHFLTERGSVNQYYVLCAAKGIRVFNASEPFAERFLERYAKTWPDRMRLSRLDVTGSEEIFEPLKGEEADQFRELEAAYALVFPDLRAIAKVSRFKPAEMPAVLTESRDQKTRREMEEVAGNVVLPGFIRDLVQGFLKEKREPLSLHLNADNLIVQRLAKRASLRDPVAGNALIALYNNAFMLLSQSITPENVRIMFGQYNAVIDMMLGLADERAKLTSETVALRTQVREVESKQAGGPKLPRWVTCFVAMPFRDETKALFEALRTVLEDVPYLWEVTRADLKVHDPSLWANVKSHMLRAHCYVADVSDANLNVYLEVGRMEAIERPLLLVKRDGTPDLPVDLKGHLYAPYGGEGEALVSRLREEIGKVAAFSALRGEGFLSETVLRRCAKDLISEAAVKKLAQSFTTCEELLAADPAETARRLGLGRGGVVDVQEALREHLVKMPASRRG